MEFVYKDKLTRSDIEQVEKFFGTLDFAPIEQHPLWYTDVENKEVAYFIAYEKSEIVCYTVLLEKKLGFLRFANIRLGPLFKDPEYLINSLINIRNHYKKRRFFYLTIQLSIFTGANTDYIEAKLHQAIRFKNMFDRNNWSSIQIRLNQDIDTIYKNFRSDHKRSIKKAQKANLSVRLAQSSYDIKALAQIYHKMESHKKFDSHSLAFIENQFLGIYEFIKKKERGFVMLVTDDSGKIIGGIINVLQGKRVRVFKGGADPEKKDVPIMHTAVFESIKIAKTMGFAYFDLWGYNHYVDKNDQIYNINLFKRGFGGEFIFYPKIMHLQFIPFSRFIYNTMLKLKKKTSQRFSANHN